MLVIPTPPKGYYGMMNSASRGTDKVVSAGLDWLTITQVEGVEVTKMLHQVMRIKTVLEEERHVGKDWEAMGYSGFQTGPLKYGERGNNEALMILSGDSAERFAYNAEINPDRVTRVDLQVTMRFSLPLPGAARELHKQLDELNQQSRRPRFLSLLQDVSGHTLYVGKRGSNVSLRFYDRSIQMGETETGVCWRYEVQYRRNHAKAAVSRVFAQSEPILAALGLVAAEFEKRGIEVRFSSKTEVVAIEVKRSVTTEEGQIAWLEKCVAPVVSQLCILGYEEAVINALSLRAIMQFIKDK